MASEFRNATICKNLETAGISSDHSREKKMSYKRIQPKKWQKNMLKTNNLIVRSVRTVKTHHCSVKAQFILEQKPRASKTLLDGEVRKATISIRVQLAGGLNKDQSNENIQVTRQLSQRIQKKTHAKRRPNYMSEVSVR